MAADSDGRPPDDGWERTSDSAAPWAWERAGPLASRPGHSYDAARSAGLWPGRRPGPPLTLSTSGG